MTSCGPGIEQQHGRDRSRVAMGLFCRVFSVVLPSGKVRVCELENGPLVDDLPSNK